MSNEFFYVPRHSIKEPFITIEGDEARHLVRVLRKKEGDSVWIVDGENHAYETIIRSINYDSVQCEILYAHEHYHESDINITLAVALLKNPSRMEWLIEKATELGAKNIVPLLTERTIAYSAKEERWTKIAVAAMKQSQRCILPHIHSPIPLQELLEHSSSHELKIIPHEQTDHTLFISEALRYGKSPRSVLIIIGPEGGFTDNEIAMAEKNFCIQVSLGKRRLRTETAAITSLSWVVGNL